MKMGFVVSVKSLTLENLFDDNQIPTSLRKQGQVGQGLKVKSLRVKRIGYIDSTRSNDYDIIIKMVKIILLGGYHDIFTKGWR
jgi:hypothetical protein